MVLVPICLYCIVHKDDLKKRINRITAAWQNGCFENDHPVYTIPNHHPTKMDVLPTNFFLQIILAAKWLVRHSSTSPLPTATTFAFPSVFICLLLWILTNNKSSSGDVDHDHDHDHDHDPVTNGKVILANDEPLSSDVDHDGSRTMTKIMTMTMTMTQSQMEK